MKKLFLPVMFLSALALSGATVPAVATDSVTVEPVAVVETVSADASAVLSPATVAVTTEPAPEPVVTPEPATEPVATAPATEPVAVPVEPAPATTAPEPVATAPEPETYPAPLPTVECLEDMPCWDCATMGNGICGNPACAALNQFTVDKAGTCSNAPIGWTVEQLRADALHEFNSRNPNPEQWLLDAFERTYVGSGILELEGLHHLRSDAIPQVIHTFN